MIQCNEINQTINELLIAFQRCKVVDPNDLRKLVELVAAVNSCANGGPNYDTKVSVMYEELTDVHFPINSFHSYSLVILNGSIEYQGAVFPKGSTLSTEFTTLNQTPVDFSVKAGGKVLFEYLIETPNG